jgi:hypothetical protein
MSSEAADTPGGGEALSSGEPPAVGEHVWVECGPYRTLAYRDQDGFWRAVATNEPVTVTKILGR